MGQTRLALFDLTADITAVMAVMSAAYGLDDAGSHERSHIILRHAARPGIIAYGAFAGEGLVGFCYGFPSHADGWWERQIRPHLLAAGTADWLDGGAFDLTELHVHPDHHGQGLGRGLLTAVLAATELPKALLSVRTDADRARRLYTSLGFADLTAPFHFGPGQPAYTVMGLALPAGRERGRARRTCPDRD
jgi:ribosomal protein S18 acetylase RimI-like enzyme